MFARGTVLVMIMAASAVAVAGCGGDDDSEANTAITTSSLSKAEFLKQVNAFCAKQRAGSLTRVAAYAKRHQDDGKPPAVLFADATRATLVPEVEANAAKIRELGAPAGDEEQIEAILRTQQEGLDAVAKMRSIKGRFQIAPHFEKAGQLAREYGLNACAHAS